MISRIQNEPKLKSCIRYEIEDEGIEESRLMTTTMGCMMPRRLRRQIMLSRWTIPAIPTTCIFWK